MAVPWLRVPAFGKAPATYDACFVETMAVAYLEQTPWTKLRLAAIQDLVQPQPGERILDLGCAAGAITDFLSGFGSHVVGVDNEPLAVERARRLFPRLDFLLADAAHLPFEDRAFDKAVAADFTEHVGDPVFREILGETHRVLRRGGTFSIYTPNPHHLIERLKERDLFLAQNPTHIGLRDASYLKGMLVGTGFGIERDEWVCSFFPVLRHVEGFAGTWLDSFRYRLCIRGSK